MHSTTVTMPKTKVYSVAFRNEVVKCHKNGEWHDKIASKYHFPRSTVCAIIKSLEIGTVVNKCERSCKLMFLGRGESMLVRIAQNDPSGNHQTK